MTLYLLPNLLGSQDPAPLLPQSVNQAVSELDGLIAEDEKAGRAFLKMFTLKKPIQQMPIFVLNEHTKPHELEALLEPVVKGEVWGVVSDAGLPCIADPGSALVRAAKRKQLIIKALVGPSSIFLALMQSGLSGQCFAFHGYIAKGSAERHKELQRWEERSKKERETQIFIETPYKNMYSFAGALEALRPETMLCVAWDLTLPSEQIVTQKVSEWKARGAPDIAKRPTIFLFSAY